MEIKEAIQALSTSGMEIYGKMCKVASVHEQQGLCDLTPLDATSDILDACYRLQEQDNNNSVPKVGSVVFCVFTSKERAFVVQASSWDKMFLEVEDVKIQIESNKISISNKEVAVEDMVREFIKIFKEMVIQTPSGAGKLSGITTGKVIELEQKLDKILK